MYANEIKLLVNTSMCWVIAFSIVGTPSRRNPNPLSLNKAIRNIPLDVDLIELIILKLEPYCFSGIYSNFVLCKVRRKIHKVQKGYIV
jgi:hypothetical protein